MKRLAHGSSLVLLVSLLLAAPALRAESFHFEGNITSGAQYDLYPIDLPDGTHVYADLTCGDPFTLDTILSIFAPGADTSDLTQSLFYNDDGGPDVCGGFRSSRLDVQLPGPGLYTFRVDGFGSATGPYTLDIETTTVAAAIPTLDVVGLILLAAALAGISLLLLRRRSAA